MDIVGALGSYRKAISNDALAFEVLFFLYKDGVKSEDSLAEAAGIDSRTLKGVLRELYQANFLRSNTPGSFGLTSLGEDICTRFGADKIVIPFILSEIVKDDTRHNYERLVDWMIDIEPEHARTATQSLKNLRVFLSYKRNTPAQQVHNLALSCIAPPNSNVRHLLKDMVSDQAMYVYFAGHGQADDTTKWKLTVADYQKAAALYDASDLVLLNACKSASSQKPSEDVRILLSFRFYNYINSENRDYMFESCVSRVPKDDKNRIWKIVLDKLPKALNSGAARSGRLHKHTTTSEAIYTWAEIAMARKASRNSSFHDEIFSPGIVGRPRVENNSIGSQGSELVSALEEYLKFIPQRSHDLASDKVNLEEIKRLRMLLERIERTVQDTESLPSTERHPKKHTPAR